MTPGIRSHSYISYMPSKYHIWFVEMGYPELDLNIYPDGEFEVIQYYNAPLVPSLTRWQQVLGPLRNMEISYGFFEKYLKTLDLQKKAIWEREEAKSKAAKEEFEKTEAHAEDMATRATQAITQNPDLMNRIGKNGLQEISMSRIARNISPLKLKRNSKIKGQIIRSDGNVLHHPSQPIEQTICEKPTQEV